MAEKKVTLTTENKIITEETTINKTNFWEANGKKIIIAAGVILVCIAGYFAYQSLVKKPNDLKGNEAVYTAENLFVKMAGTGFSADSVNILLNGGSAGDVNVTGLLKVISNYGGTPASNRAKYMAGAAYLHIKQFDKAIKYLNDFNANGAYQLDIKKNMMLGHAYAEQKKIEVALSAYKKAATINDKDEAFTADALITAAAYADVNGKIKDAIELYEKVKSTYPAYSAVTSGEVDKQLAKLGVTK